MIGRVAIALVYLFYTFWPTANCWAQAFSSGSTGSDGAYNPTQSGIFDPAAFTPPLNPAGDNVFNFTTINIPAGVTITLRADKLRNASVIWLATGNVSIAGSLVLDGQTAPTVNSTSFATIVQTRVYPIPGPGGYTGGLGSRDGVGGEAGAGPGGGSAGSQNGSYCTAGSSNSGATYGSLYLVPLLGGSGGGGGVSSSGIAIGGGAGGGAIRIVSTTQISVTGRVSASGGTGANYFSNGHGSGGAIHLIAPVITGTGTLSVAGGSTGDFGQFRAGSGWIRFNTTANNFTGNTSGVSLNQCFNVGPLYNVPPNNAVGLPSLTMTQINGIAVPPNPTGAYFTPDIQINASTPVNVNIAAANIPIGTVVKLRLQTETAGDVLIDCNPLAGPTAASTAICAATFPFSISIASVRATW